MIKNVNHVSFTVNNLRESVDFYTKVLGLELLNLADRDEEFSSAVTGISGAKLNIAYIKADGCNIELIEYTGAKGDRLDTATNNNVSAQLCVNVVKFDEWIEHLKKNSVRFRGELCQVPAGPNLGRKVCYAMDNDGNNLEFIEVQA